MARTKADQALIDNLTEERDMARALRWPEYSAPERTAPPDRGFSSGFDFNSYRALSSVSVEVGEAVYAAWSSTVTHGTGEPGKNGSQNSRSLYPSRADALRALRIEVTEMFARKLAAIDRAIAEAE